MVLVTSVFERSALMGSFEQGCSVNELPYGDGVFPHELQARRTERTPVALGRFRDASRPPQGGPDRPAGAPRTTGLSPSHHMAMRW